MTLRQALDRISRTLDRAGGLTIPRVPDRLDLMADLRDSINDLLEMEEWTWGVTFATVAGTETGKEDYVLPADFRNNFLVGDEGYGRAVKISDGTSDSDLTYESQNEYFSRNRTGVANGNPSVYTITDRSGRKVMWLWPKPDSTTRTVFGAYRYRYLPDLERQDELIPVPSEAYVVYDVLLRQQENPDWRDRHGRALRALYMEHGRKVQIRPQLGHRNTTISDWDNVT